MLIGQCPKNGQLFNTSDTVFSSKVMQQLLGKADNAFIASDWVPICRGMIILQSSQLVLTHSSNIRGSFCVPRPRLPIALLAARLAGM